MALEGENWSLENQNGHQGALGDGGVVLRGCSQEKHEGTIV